MPKQPSLSLVITSYSMSRLNDTLELMDSVKNQTQPDIELIFVAEGSCELRDKVQAYASEKAIPNTKVILNEGERGLSVARNLGIRHASADIIAFVDDDVVLFPDWAEKMVKAHSDKAAIGVTGPALPLWEDTSLQWLPEEFYWLISCIAWTGWKEKRAIRGAFGANMAFKKDAFEDGCLFSPNAGYARTSQHQPVSEDLEFSLRIRKKTKRPILFNPGPRVHHRVHQKRLSWKFVAARSHQIGCTRRIIRKYYAAELGSFEQEKRVLGGTFRLLWKIPAQFFTKPKVAWNRLSLITIALASTAIGYLVPIPTYSPIVTEKVPAS